MEKQSVDLANYVKGAMGELQFLIITLTAERDNYAKQVQELKTELEKVKNVNSIPKKRVSE